MSLGPCPTCGAHAALRRTLDGGEPCPDPCHEKAQAAVEAVVEAAVKFWDDIPDEERTTIGYPVRALLATLEREEVCRGVL